MSISAQSSFSLRLEIPRVINQAVYDVSGTYSFNENITGILGLAYQNEVKDDIDFAEARSLYELKGGMRFYLKGARRISLQREKDYSYNEEKPSQLS